MTAALVLALAATAVAGCSTTRSTPRPAASPAAPTWDMPSPVPDVCARIDTASVAGMLNRPGLQAVPLNKDPIAGSLGLGGHVCHLQVPKGATFEIGINPIPMTAAIPGPDQAMRTLLGLDSLDGKRQVPGVGDLALYAPMEAAGTAGTVQFWAVQGKDVRWYGVTIWGYDPTPEHSILGTLSQEQLVDLAKRCLGGL